MVTFSPVFRIRIPLNPDPDTAKNLNLNSDLQKTLNPDLIYFLILSGKKLKLLSKYKILSSKEVN